MHVTYSCSKKSSHFVAATNTRVIPLTNSPYFSGGSPKSFIFQQCHLSRHLTLHFCSPMKMYKLHLKEIIPNAFYFKKKCEELYLIIVLSHVLFYFVKHETKRKCATQKMSSVH